jgi:acyl-CoA thioester hydrolase
MNDFSTKLELRIDWSEIDLFGHVNNVAILKYVQAARINYLEAIGLMQLQSATKIGPILASTSCQFRKPLFYPGQVMLDSKVDSIKNTSFRIQHRLYNDHQEIFAEAQDIIVFFDYIKNSKLIIPNEIREKIESLEHQQFNGERYLIKIIAAANQNKERKVQ